MVKRVPRSIERGKMLLEFKINRFFDPPVASDWGAFDKNGLKKPRIQKFFRNSEGLLQAKSQDQSYPSITAGRKNALRARGFFDKEEKDVGTQDTLERSFQ